MRSVQLAIDAFGHEQLTTLLNGGTVDLQVEGESIALTPEDVAVERQVRDGLIAANQGTITIALDTALTEELLIEGLPARLLTRLIPCEEKADLKSRIVFM